MPRPTGDDDDDLRIAAQRRADASAQERQRRLRIALAVIIGVLLISGITILFRPTPAQVTEVICSDAIGKSIDHSEDIGLPSFDLNLRPGCFGPAVKFPRSWTSWIYQSDKPGWMSSWNANPAGSPTPLVALPNHEKPSAREVRFEGTVKITVVALHIAPLTPTGTVPAAKAQQRDPYVENADKNYGSTICNDALAASAVIDHTDDKALEFVDVPLQEKCFGPVVKLPKDWYEWRSQSADEKPGEWVAVLFVGQTPEGPESLTRTFALLASFRFRLQGRGTIRFIKAQ